MASSSGVEYCGLAATADVWGSEELTDAMTYQERLAVTEVLLRRLDRENLFQEDASDEDARLLYHQWPFPMWDFDLSPIVATFVLIIVGSIVEGLIRG